MGLFYIYLFVPSLPKDILVSDFFLLQVYSNFFPLIRSLFALRLCNRFFRIVIILSELFPYKPSTQFLGRSVSQFGYKNL